jgi:hypothetical protein
MEEENDITIEESTEEGEAISAGSKVKKLQDRIKELEKDSNTIKTYVWSSYGFNE